MPGDRIEIVDRPERDRYELELDGKRVGLLTYRLTGSVVTLQHTEIDPVYGGRGLGSALARFVLDDARARSLSVEPRCRFVAVFIERHPEYADLVAR
jgi:uncharacterized protein